MIRLTRQADYGILLMVQVASAAPSAVLAAPDLASATGLPVPMVSKILKALARARLLESHRGPRGGYSLGKPASSISLVDVLEALEGPIAMTACTGDHPDCGLESRCSVHGHWQHINRTVIDALRRVTLEQMSRPLPGTLVSLEAGDRTLSFPAQ